MIDIQKAPRPAIWLFVLAIMAGWVVGWLSFGPSAAEARATSPGAPVLHQNVIQRGNEPLARSGDPNTIPQNQRPNPTGSESSGPASSWASPNARMSIRASVVMPPTTQQLAAVLQAQLLMMTTSLSSHIYLPTVIR